jgi:heat shock protein HtpX
MWEQIRYNQTRSAMLIIGMMILLPLLGYILSITFTAGHNRIAGVIIALLLFGMIILIDYLHGDNILLALSRAKKISPDDLQRLYNIVEEITIASGLETIPAIYVIDDPALNAFATGRNPNRAAIIVTSGLLAKLNRDELQGVIGHEIAHIKNQDVQLMALCRILYITMMVLTLGIALIFLTIEPEQTTSTKTDYRPKPSGSDWPFIFLMSGVVLTLAISFIEFDSIPLLSYLLFSAGCIDLLFFIWMPIAAYFILFAVSKRREYLADASSALYTRYPEGLASALEKIAASTDQLKSANLMTSTIYITSPFRKNGMAASDHSESHPPTSERTAILRSMTGVSYADYNLAYKQFYNTDKNAILSATTTTADSSPVRPPQPDNLDDIQRARETSNALWNLNNYKLVTCACGTRMRLPPSYKQPEIKCPHCGRINPV